MKPRRTYSREDPDTRRQELIEAMVRCLAKHGHARASVRVIAAEAGVSPGLIRHHFGEKSKLTAATYRYVGSILMNQSNAAVEAAGSDGWARLTAFLRAGFTPPVLTRDYITVRFVLWGAAMTDPEMRRIHIEVNQRYRRLMQKLLRDIAGPKASQESLRQISMQLSATLNGLWLDWCLNPKSHPPDDLLETTVSVVRTEFRPGVAIRGHTSRPASSGVSSHYAGSDICDS